MGFADQSTIVILESALKREQESRDFYSECYDKATVSGTKKILAGLIEDENRHADVVSNMIDEAKKNVTASMVGFDRHVTGKILIDQAFAHKKIEAQAFAAESATVGAMLKKALENEKESFEIYSNAAGKTDDSNAAETLTSLAREESRHYEMIGNLIGYLADPGEWIYDEENQLFQL